MSGSGPDCRHLRVVEGLVSVALAATGKHDCFLGAPEGPQGSAEIRVMGHGVAYAAPELVAHYVEAHGYLPPIEFMEAVLSSDTVA
ncbi:DUF7919 family protein [Streptomyces rubiginosohelvolus]